MDRIIKLPQPDMSGTMLLEKAIAKRRSCREYASEPLTLKQIGQLCWAAQGSAGRLKNVPSAGATYPLEVFIVSSAGLLHYLSDKHCLEELRTEDLRGKLAAACWGQAFVEQAPLTVLLAAEFKRTTGRYGKRGFHYVYMEAGHAAQNIHLEAEALGLNSVAVGAFDDAAVKAVLKLPENIEPVYMVVVGKGKGDIAK